jgi:hypothetical protein
MDLSQFETFLQLMRKYDVLVATCGEMSAQLAPAFPDQTTAPDDDEVLTQGHLPGTYETLKRQLGVR